MSDYFFGRFADLVAPLIMQGNETGTVVREKRVKEVKASFLNKYVYLILFVLILLLVAIFYLF